MSRLLLCAVLLVMTAVAHGQVGRVEGEVLVRYRADAGEVLHPRVDSSRTLHTITRGGLRRVELLRSESLGTDELIELLRADPDVELVEPNYIHYSQSTVPDDPLFAQQWALARIGAAEAWDVTTGAPEVVVAVIDSGVDYLHEDLAGNLWTSSGPGACSSLTAEEAQWMAGVHGYDFAATASGADGPDPMDIDGHGTHMAGTIAAVGDNATGISGVAWRASLIAVKATRPAGGFETADTLQAYAYVRMLKVKCGVNIVAVNASYGSAGSGGTMEREAIVALGDAGIVFVAAAGNGSGDNDITAFHPANYNLPNILSVTAIDEADDLAGFANRGFDTVHLAAPGRTILSTVVPWEGQGEIEVGATAHNASVFVYSRATPPGGITAELHHCGLALSPGDCPPEVAGELALIERGEINFSVKVEHARAAGAVGVIIYNSVEGGESLINGTLSDPGNWLPTVGVGRNLGLALRDLAAPTVTMRTIDVYQPFSGTSSATAHVTGAVALVAARYPGESAVLRIDRILAGTEQLPSLEATTRTGGLLNLPGALRDHAHNPPVRPGRPWVNADTPDRVTMSWEDRSLNEEGFTVERRSGRSAFAPVSTTPIDAELYHDDSVQPGAHYIWQVRAFNAAGASGPTRAIARMPEVADGAVVEDGILAGDWHVYRVPIGANRPRILVELEGISGDTELFMQRNVPPMHGNFACRGEVCDLANPGASVWHIGVYAETDADYRFTVTVAPPLPPVIPQPQPEPPRRGGGSMDWLVLVVLLGLYGFRRRGRRAGA